MAEEQVRSAAYETAKNVWRWSEDDAKDLANNAVQLFSEKEELKGRPLKEFWDVNPTRLLEKHKLKTNGELRTRFPPEPNGYAHTGHAKSMFMNFREAFERTNSALPQEKRHTTFRYDDTNPEVESQEYIDKLAEAVAWLGWKPAQTTFTSDYFPQMYEFALRLIDSGDAYVCHQTGDEIERSRALAQKRHEPDFDPANPGESPESPWRNTSPAETRKKFYDMKRGLYGEGEASLRLKMDMNHPNPNMWDPVAYRVIFHAHPHAGDTWCIYPTYDYSHCIVDSLEDIDYSICTLEFETRRESYYWLLWKLDLYRPKVFEFARLDLTRTVMSKRKLKKLVETKEVRGWDDPRMPTLMGMRRRGFAKDSINKFMEEIGVTRSMSTVDVARFYAVVHRDLEELVPRCFGILDPVLLELENIPNDFYCVIQAPTYPQKKNSPTSESRDLILSRICYVDRENVRADATSAPDDFYGLVPGRFVRLRYGVLVECKEAKVDASGKVVALKGECWFAEDSPHASLNASPIPAVKPKGVLHWLSARPGQVPMKFEARLYDHLLLDDGETKNPKSEVVIKDALIEGQFVANMVAKAVEAEENGGDIVQRFQLERVGFFCLDIVDNIGTDRVVLNRILPLHVWVDPNATASATAGTLAEKGRSRKEERTAQAAAKAERLKYPVKDFFKRPGEAEKWAEFDETGFPTRAAGAEGPLSKNQTKQLKKELEKHKSEREAEGFTD